jgi:hypothetical protein
MLVFIKSGIKEIKLGAVGGVFGCVEPAHANLNRQVLVDGRLITDISGFVKLFNALVVSVFGADFRQLHDVGPVDGENTFKTVEIPILEQGHVKADMIARKPGIDFDTGEEGV